MELSSVRMTSRRPDRGRLTDLNCWPYNLAYPQVSATCGLPPPQPPADQTSTGYRLSLSRAVIIVSATLCALAITLPHSSGSRSGAKAQRSRAAAEMMIKDELGDGRSRIWRRRCG